MIEETHDADTFAPFYTVIAEEFLEMDVDNAETFVTCGVDKNDALQLLKINLIHYIRDGNELPIDKIESLEEIATEDPDDFLDIISSGAFRDLLSRQDLVEQTTYIALYIACTCSVEVAEDFEREVVLTMLVILNSTFWD